ncbi:MAG: glutamine synthetase family protein [Candidatus Eremiobacteraeota bacterium]|nr:glutamine synthetase family protein [Candidatus Eremiobacteraeota bacterium]
MRLVFADILGISKSVSIPISELERALEGGVTFDGGSIDGFVRGEELDMVLQPDIATFAVYPWGAQEATEARIICDIATPDGTPFEGCPRTTLKRVLENSAAFAPDVRIALEIEFYLFEGGEGGSTHTPDVGSYFDFAPSDRGEEARTAIVAALGAMGITVSGSHHEHGNGQHEIDLPHGAPLAVADQLFTLRGVAKHIARQYGLDATFMPKPLEHQAGSGLHVDFRFGDGEGRASDGLQDDALYFIGGLLNHAPAVTAICNSTVNSYKRLVAAWDAPVYTVWSARSANALVRVPSGRHPARIEMRSPDGAGNPYLVLAALLGAGCDGISHTILPGEALVGSTYDLTERERRERGIGTLPKSLRQAITELDADPVVRKSLGDHIYHAFRDAKLAEYERYRRAVHPWEREAYLRIY